MPYNHGGSCGGAFLGENMKHLIWSSMIAVVALLPLGAQAQQHTLDVVKKRDKLLCGVNGDAPGFSAQNAEKEWQGIDVDLCRAIAAAILGSASKVQFIPTTAQDRFTRLIAGEFDVLVRNSTINLERSVGTKVRFTSVNYYDGQAFVVPKTLGAMALGDLHDKIICVIKGTDHEYNMGAYFKARRIEYIARPFDKPDDMYKALFEGRCQAATQDASALAAAIVASGKAADYAMLRDFITKEPLGPYVREGDSGWLDVVRWTQYAMLEAEERGIGKANVDDALTSADFNVQRFLGVISGYGKILGLGEKWAYNIVKQVGNYGESFERNLGQESPLKFGRGINALWTNGGAMISPPMR
jgi:general L-amino acid transport system substrate-binding protein